MCLIGIRIVGDGELELTPLESGSSVGGTVWKITYKLETILYCPHIYNKTQNIADGFAIDENTKYPRMLIIDSAHVEDENEEKESFKGKRMSEISEREKHKWVFTKIKETLRKGGNVIISSDSSNRVLELLLFIENIFLVNQGLRNFQPIFLQHMTHTIEYAKSHIEFMSKTLSEAFYTIKENPFDFKYLIILNSNNYLDSYISAPI